MACLAIFSCSVMLMPQERTEGYLRLGKLVKRAEFCFVYCCLAVLPSCQRLLQFSLMLALAGILSVRNSFGDVS